MQAQIDNGEDPVSANERRWLSDYAARGSQDARIPALLAQCPIPTRRSPTERDRATPLFLRTATKSAAVTDVSAHRLPETAGVPGTRLHHRAHHHPDGLGRDRSHARQPAADPAGRRLLMVLESLRSSATRSC